MENEPIKQKSSWLSELESKSWSLEMTISGAATVAVSFLPGLIDQGLNYYMDNLAPSNDKFGVMFPILSYSFFMGVAWVLIVFFVAHLCIRALWVSAVGLHSAFPAGIRYKHIPNVSEQYKKLAEAKYGSLEDYIYRLDKRGNKMFALAFVLSMGFGGVGIVYILVFLFMLLLRSLLTPEMNSIITTAFSFLFLGIALIITLSTWWLKRRPERERIGHWLAKFQLDLMRVVNPLFANAQQYLTQTFLSNISKVSYYSGIMLITVFMSVVTVFIAVKKIGQTRGSLKDWDRSFYSRGSDAYRLSNAAYDALRPADAFLPTMSIPADVVKEPYLPVFVKYPRFLDARLAKFCGEITDVQDTSLSRKERARKADSLNIACLQRFFTLQLNDSIVPAKDWLFHEKTGTKGLITYLDTRRFPPGKNTLFIKIPSEAKPDSLEVFGQLYFWYAPE